MSSLSHSKKQKHRPTENVDTNRKKKEKRHKEVAPRPNSPQDKGKSRASDHLSEFRMINARIVLSIPPVFASDLRVGVEEMLDSMIMRYIPSLQGVLLAHSNIQFLNQTARIRGDCPFAVCDVRFDATVWGPRVSMKLVGRVNLCSPDHISLLVHRTFNVSIPRHHIPQDQWSFEYGPAENDPEFGGGRDWDAGDESKGTRDGEGKVEIGDPTPEASGASGEAESSGRWVHHLTGSRIGEPDGYVEFTVIGLTVANEMLSLQGSIQPDPFSPEHVPHPVNEVWRGASSADDISDTEVHAEYGKEVQEDGDGLKQVTKLTDEAKSTPKAKGAKSETERPEKTKKRKRREGHGGVSEEYHHGKGAKRKRIKENT